MARYVNLATSSYITLQQAKAANPNIAVGNPLKASDYAALGIAPVTETPWPTTTILQRASLTGPVKSIDGSWETTYELTSLDAGLTGADLLAFKQNLASTLSNGFSAKRASLIAAGFQYDFSAYTTDAGIACSTLTPNTAPGVLTIQMDTASQVNWLGVTAEAQVELATATFAVSALTIGADGAGYTVGTGYPLTAAGNGTGFTGTVDVDATGNLTNPQLVTPGQGYSGTTTINVDVSAGTPTTPGVITPVILQPQAFALRVAENYNVIVPATDIVKILGDAAKWATTLVFVAASLKDQLNALAVSATATPEQMVALSWPAGS